jgi:hypothetical protein
MQLAGGKKKQPNWLLKFGTRNFLSPGAPNQVDETC